MRNVAPQDHWRTPTFLSALRCDQLPAPCALDGPINGPYFHTHVEQQCVPVLKSGDIVITDTPGSHESAALRHMIKAGGVRLRYLQPCSLDLNPIEQALAKIKHEMRAAQKLSVNDVWRHIEQLVETIEPHRCCTYFADAGYASVKM